MELFYDNFGLKLLAERVRLLAMVWWLLGLRLPILSTIAAHGRLLLILCFLMLFGGDVGVFSCNHFLVSVSRLCDHLS